MFSSGFVMEDERRVGLPFIHIYSDFHTDYKTIKNTCLGTFDLTVLIN